MHTLKETKSKTSSIFIFFEKTRNIMVDFQLLNKPQYKLTRSLQFEGKSTRRFRFNQFVHFTTFPM